MCYLKKQDIIGIRKRSVASFDVEKAHDRRGASDRVTLGVKK